MSEDAAPESPDDIFGYRRLPALDAIVADDRLCLLQGNSVIVLDGIGPTVWDLARRSTTLSDLVAGVVRAHGAPPAGDATSLVAQTVRELLEAGVLEEIGRKAA